ncbi:hypothetical protein SAMN05192529_10643 [Arachidicoccus rhizosphaerae]|uniref:Lipoprotein n=1 Tax=Arachidicoccus rhizosphaerae TaxID=551991 RepID=A0A1H3XPY8_9BACT|nr:lipoprotein [Arachidicoccus rhizosphaerae]SEA01416.1 hypothetical protein SAMN05192529_10643 [Arachidicoccus rhizosphaerae]
MKKLTVILGILLILSSCSALRVNYYGRSTTPTDKVDMYLYAKDISTPYIVLGRAEFKGNPYTLLSDISEKAKNTLIEQGRKVGADAVVLYDESNAAVIPAIKTTTTQESTVNALGDSIITSTSVTSPINNNYILSPVFVQYK